MADISTLVKTATEQGKKLLTRYKNDPKFRAKANKGAGKLINVLKGKKSTQTNKSGLMIETPKAKAGDVIRINKTGERAVVLSADNKGNYKINTFEQVKK